MAELRSTNPQVNLFLEKKFLKPDLTIDWTAVQLALGLYDIDLVASAILFLYQTNSLVNETVNRAIIQIVLNQSRGAVSHLPMVPSTADEAAFLKADQYCDRCPGSELFEPAPGLSVPRCMNFNRADKWADCLKYRENVIAAEPTEDERAQAFKQLKLSLEITG